MKHKTMPADMAPDNDSGTFEAIVSVFNNKDYGGDIVRPGAFEKSLKMWNDSGNPIPVYWSHRMDDPTYNIGEVVEAKEIGPGEAPEWANSHVRENGGLYVKAQLDDFGLGAHVAHLLQKRRVKQFSFSYDVINEQKSASGENELLDLALHEVGPTPLGMNPLTELLSAKGLDVVAARKLFGIPEPPPPEPDDRQAAGTRRLFSCRKTRAQLGVFLASTPDTTDEEDSHA